MSNNQNSNSFVASLEEFLDCEDRKNTIEFYLRQGFSYHEIAKIVKVSSSTAHKIRLDLGLPARIDKGGRPKALTEREQQHLVRTIAAEGLENAIQAQQSLEQNLGKSVSVDIKEEAPMGSLAHLLDSKRLDERHMVRRKDLCMESAGQTVKNHQVRETVKHGGGSIIVWSCISWYGPGYIVNVGKNMTKGVYLEVLQDDLMKSLARYVGESGKSTSQFIFMQESDPKHTAKSVSKWLYENYDCLPCGIHQLWDHIGHTWYQIAAEECQNSIKNNTVSVKKTKESCFLIKPITPNVSFSLDSSCFDEDTRAKVVKVAHIKIRKDCICEDQSLIDEYIKNVEESKAMSCIKRLPAAVAFLSGALDQDLKTFLPWLGANGFDDEHVEEEKKAILFIRLVLTDFYANCM
ncbi:hypothetical protein G6F43_011771 [Rhizopus delemar]|nr:hypothetical protein G6F43_011771 [Rhizopus delemar]